MLLFIMFLYSFLGGYHVFAGNDEWAIGCMIVSIIALAADAIVTEIKRGRTK